MPPWITLLSAFCLAGPPAPRPRKPSSSPLPTPGEQSLALRAAFPSLLVQVQTRVAQDQDLKDVPGATVEVIGHDDAAALKLLSLRIRDQVRLEFHPMDTQGQRELYAFMHQDPSHPASVLLIPPLAGAPVASPGDAWKR